MVVAIETPFGHPLPDTPSSHAITTHAAGWATIQGLADGDPEIMSKIKTIYPRFGPSNQAKALIGAVMTKLDPGQMCFLFPGLSSAEACKEFITSTDRKENAVREEDASIKAFDVHFRVYATVFPADKVKTAIPFWQDPGVAITTRFAEDCLKHIDQLKEVPLDSPAAAWPSSPAYDILKQRIVDLLERAPGNIHSKKVSTDDIYLYQTGMAAIYQPHMHLSSARPGTTILYGFAFHSTPHIFERYGSNKESFKWFARGGDTELSALESFAQEETTAGRRIQALWAEFPTNPNLTVPNITRLKEIGTKHSFPIIIDDTISSFANVDLFGDDSNKGADALVTSLTKTFSGYADVMAGSFIPNPASSTYYPLFKTILSQHYIPELYPPDAEALERNSRDFLQRTSILNRNAEHLVSFLSHPRFSRQIAKIYYPAVPASSSAPCNGHDNENQRNYTPHLRCPTPILPNPGYGCLFSIDFTSLEHTIAFYNNLALHCGPHLGAHRTLALAYPRLLVSLAKSDEVVVGKGGLSERIVRVSVGLEEEGVLEEVFEDALRRAERIVDDAAAVAAVGMEMGAQALG